MVVFVVVQEQVVVYVFLQVQYVYCGVEQFVFVGLEQFFVGQCFQDVVQCFVVVVGWCQVGLCYYIFMVLVYQWDFLWVVVVGVGGEQVKEVLFVDDFVFGVEFQYVDVIYVVGVMYV